MFRRLFHPRDAFFIFLSMEGAVAFSFSLIFTVNMVYQVTVVELNPLQLVLVGTLLESTIFLFEIPTGIVADVYSRRLSIITGYLLIGLGFITESSIARFEAVLLAQVLWGLGYTFTSGATQAWIADEVGEERAGNAFMRGAQIGAIGGLIAIPISVGLASLNVRLPILLGGLLFMLSGLRLLLIMPEKGFKPVPAEERESWRTMIHTFRAGLRVVRGRTVLMSFVGISIFFGLYSEGMDRLWTAHLLTNFTLPSPGGLKPVTWFGIIGATGMLLSIISTEIARRRLNSANPRHIVRVLFVLSGLMVTSIIAFGLAPRFGIALAAFLMFGMLRSTSGPIFTAWINPHIESSVRATVFSMTSQVDAISQVVGGPGLGFIGTRFSIRAAIVCSGIVLSPVLLLYTFVLRRIKLLPIPGEKA
ncbi:MAG: MFS transporter [Chloroflexi bacterium]|nr:MFS transporter [Chloroflexota bacterium]